MSESAPHKAYINKMVKKGFYRTGIYKHMRNQTKSIDIGLSALPDYWFFNPQSLTYQWHEVVCSNDVSDQKTIGLYYLKDFLEGHFISIEFYKHYLAINKTIDFDPYDSAESIFNKRRPQNLQREYAQMTQPTHTHKTQGGRYALIGEQPGGGVLEGQTLACYHDLDKDLKSVTTMDDWRQHWRPLQPDDCTVCMGTGHDHIKCNKANPCGHCFGLGKFRKDGETPSDRWELSEVAQRIIIALENDVAELTQAIALPGVRDMIIQQRQQTITDSMGREYQEWADGSGHGPGGRRYTGD